MKPQFCLYCAQPLEPSDDTVYRCPNHHEFFNNPRATVAIIFLKNDWALFSKRGIEPSKGKYDFPGGFLNYNESPYDGAIRETVEETSVIITAADLGLVAVYSGEYTPFTSVVDIVFVCTSWTGEFIPQDDSAALEWKPLAFATGPQSNVQYYDLEAKIQATLNTDKL